MIALTGYEGVLGYRTDEVYRTREAGRVTEYQQKFFDEHPDFDEAAWQNEVDQATAVANAMNELMSHEVVNVYVTEKAELAQAE